MPNHLLGENDASWARQCAYHVGDLVMAILSLAVAKLALMQRNGNV